MKAIIIESIQEYNQIIKRGHIDPLLFDQFFVMTKELRKEIIEMKFGHYKNNVMSKSKQKFYRYVWDNKINICEECGLYLREYSSTYISHILSRGAYPEFALDPRNTNILCKSCHNRWEFGDKRMMNIYKSNQEIINKLKNEEQSQI